MQSMSTNRHACHLFPERTRNVKHLAHGVRRVERRKKRMLRCQNRRPCIVLQHGSLSGQSSLIIDRTLRHHCSIDAMDLALYEPDSGFHPACSRKHADRNGDLTKGAWLNACLLLGSFGIFARPSPGQRCNVHLAHDSGTIWLVLETVR
jgi:hypothetical protein